ncbi:GNAT family N-acetyltransferase [Colwelliaceae bacterium 6471]
MEIRKISWQQTIPLRNSVLWPEKTAEYCHVDGDNDALHFGAFINDKLVCVASVYLKLNKARLRKFATDTHYQNQGVGSKMIKHIIQSLKNIETSLFWCDARESALGFYKRFGMQQYGERFYKEEVPYFKMEVSL